MSERHLQWALLAGNVIAMVAMVYFAFAFGNVASGAVALINLTAILIIVGDMLA